MHFAIMNNQKKKENHAKQKPPWTRKCCKLQTKEGHRTDRWNLEHGNGNGDACNGNQVPLNPLFARAQATLVVYHARVVFLLNVRQFLASFTSPDGHHRWTPIANRFINSRFMALLIYFEMDFFS